MILQVTIAFILGFLTRHLVVDYINEAMREIVGDGLMIIPRERGKYGLQAGACCKRFICRNVNKECCHPIPNDKQSSVRCSNFDEMHPYE